MKRHNFGGGRKTHGSKFHRANGSTGMAAWPSKVIKGTKMAGRMGGERSTVLNLRVFEVNEEEAASSCARCGAGSKQLGRTDSSGGQTNVSRLSRK